MRPVSDKWETSTEYSNCIADNNQTMQTSQCWIQRVFPNCFLRLVWKGHRSLHIPDFTNNCLHLQIKNKFHYLLVTSACYMQKISDKQYPSFRIYVSFCNFVSHKIFTRFVLWFVLLWCGSGQFYPYRHMGKSITLRVSCQKGPICHA